MLSFICLHKSFIQEHPIDKEILLRISVKFVNTWTSGNVLFLEVKLIWKNSAFDAVSTDVF